MEITTINDYEDKKSEVRYFLHIINKFDKYILENYDSNNKSEFWSIVNYKNFNFTHFFRIMKSNFILMLYNFIESSIALFINKIYYKLEDDKITYKKASKELQQMWLKNLFSESLKEDSSYKTYRNKAIEIVDSVLNDSILKFETNKISKFQGNINAKLIRKIWTDHGIEYKSNSKAQDPNGRYSIDTIKNDRNALAHGRKSFINCGSDYTTVDLEQFYLEIEKLLDDLLTSVNNFIESEKYLAK